MSFEKTHARKINHSHICIYAYVKVFGLVMLLAGVQFLLLSEKSFAGSNMAIIENNVNATANTGGNVVEGSGEVKTGSASASSSSSTTVNSDGKTNVEVKAKAEANGEKVEAEVSEINPKEDISIQREVKDDGAMAKVDIEVDTNDADEMNVAETANNEVADSAEKADVSGENSQENKNFFASMANNISSAIKGFFDSIVSFIS